jgi:hypothetical protein
MKARKQFKMITTYQMSRKEFMQKLEAEYVGQSLEIDQTFQAFGKMVITQTRKVLASAPVGETRVHGCCDRSCLIRCELLP